MINLEISREEFTLIKSLLEREAAETRIELHHARHDLEFRDSLKTREKEIKSFLERLEKGVSVS